MAIRHIALLSETFELNKTGKALQKKLNALVEDFNTKLREFDREVGAATDTDPDEISGLAGTVDALEKRKLDLLVDERKVRVLMNDYFDARATSHMSERDRLRVAWEQTKVKLTEGLVALGYVEGPIPGSNTLSITPDFYFRHPECRAAQANYQSMGTNADDDPPRANRQRIAAIDNEVRAVRERLLRIAGR